MSLCCLAFGMSCSNLLMSLAQFGFGIAVFAVPDYLTKLKRLLKNPVALLWIGLYVLFLLGGFGSENTDYFLKDIRTKMPIWVMPAALALMPDLSRRHFALVLHFFVAGCLVAMLAGWYNLFTGAVVDRRDLSPLLSHIRLGLYLVLSLFILLRFLLRRNTDMIFFPKFVYVLVFGVLVFWLFYLKSFTAVIFFLLLFPPALFFLTLPRIKKAWRITFYSVFAALVVGVTGYAVYCVKAFYVVNPVNFAELPELSPSGNPYLHDRTLTSTENGNYIWLYVQTKEMREAWGKRSQLPYDEVDKKGNKLEATLIRYLTSKNLPKDNEGVLALTADDVRNVENGIPNYLYAEPFNIKGRIYEILWELEVYSGSDDPSGKSMSTRIELWKAAWAAALKSPFSGYGTGDVRTAIDEELTERHSKLAYYGQFGPHNQYLGVWLAIGIPGLLWLLTSLLWPVFSTAYRPSFLFYAMLALLMLSALNEDIFETQASVTFFAFGFHFLLSDGRRPHG